MTVCIAAICDLGTDPTSGITSPKLLLCADRLVSTIVQFEALGTSKIRVIGKYFLMATTNDSNAVQIITNNVIHRVRELKNISIKQTADVISEECIKFKKSTIEKDILFKYELITDKLKINPDTLAKEAKSELDSYIYELQIELIIAGIEKDAKHPEIYTINQNGNIRQHDSIGFVTIGSGESLALSELTRHRYSPYTDLSRATMLVYFAKKAAERAIGVGDNTDLVVVHLVKKDESMSTDLAILSKEKIIMQKLAKAFNEIHSNEGKEVENTSRLMKTEIYDLLKINDQTPIKPKK
ncbi:MAG TPA: hypothetical protein VJ571_01090 [Candidatus Nitrosotalea sp.]|nr:hypothetical protein [Candidatus Nitrosotalea sp.]